MSKSIEKFLKTSGVHLEENFPYAYYEPIKDKIYLAGAYQGDATNQLMYGHDGKNYADLWYFTEKYSDTGLFYFLGRV